MRTLLWYFALIALLTVPACDKRGASERATDEFLKVEAQYQSADVRVAEQALLGYRNKLFQEQRQGTRGIDFDQAFGIADARLFLIYRATGQTNKMEAFFRSSVEAFTRVAVSKGHPAPNFTHDSLRDVVEKFDRGLSVKWKEQMRP